MLNFSKLFLKNPGNLNDHFTRLNKLIAKLAKCPFPIADDLQCHTLFISKTLSVAYKTTAPEKKVELYLQAKATIETLQKILSQSINDELISQKRLVIITKDIHSLNKSIKRIILLLEEHIKLTDTMQENSNPFKPK